MRYLSPNHTEDNPNKWFCDGCKCLNPEYYMIHHKLWRKVVNKGDFFICLNCVESRLKRQLTIHDFTDVPVNHGCFGWYANVWLKSQNRKVS